MKANWKALGKKKLSILVSIYFFVFQIIFNGFKNLIQGIFFNNAFQNLVYILYCKYREIDQIIIVQFFLKQPRYMQI